MSLSFTFLTNNTIYFFKQFENNLHIPRRQKKRAKMFYPPNVSKTFYKVLLHILYIISFNLHFSIILLKNCFSINSFCNDSLQICSTVYLICTHAFLYIAWIKVPTSEEENVQRTMICHVYYLLICYVNVEKTFLSVISECIFS